MVSFLDIDCQLHCVNSLVGVGAANTLRLKAATAKATFVNFMVMVLIFLCGDLR